MTFTIPVDNKMIADFSPVIRVLYRGELVALASADGVVLYSTPEGDRLLGSYSATRGQNLSNYLHSLSDIMEFCAFLRKTRDELHRNTCVVKTRSSKFLVIDADLRVRSSWDTAWQSSVYDDADSSLLRKSSRSHTIESEGDMSFADAFEQAAVEDADSWTDSTTGGGVAYYNHVWA